jgi:ATP-dependent Lon protease
MTGEATLRGAVLPVGGVKEKVLAAHRAGIRTVLLPDKCKKDLVEVPKEIRDEMTFHFCSRMEEVLGYAFGADKLAARKADLRAELEARTAAKGAGGEAHA